MTASRSEELFETVRVLSEQVWPREITRPVVERWLANFAEDRHGEPSERWHALYLLSRFTYFGDPEVRALLRTMYANHCRYPIVEAIRLANGDTLDPDVIGPACDEELKATRFLGVGNPAESGQHLLMPFRQENRIPHLRFPAFDDLLAQLARGQVRRVVFIDDFCGTGSTAIRALERRLPALRDAVAASDARLHVSLLFVGATTIGLRDVRDTLDFDAVEAVLELDDSYRSLSPGSRYFGESAPEGVDREFIREVAERNGARLEPEHPLGFNGGELLLGFSHNTPNNTLPVIWAEKPHWQPIFKRHEKVYGS